MLTNATALSRTSHQEERTMDQLGKGLDYDKRELDDTFLSVHT